MKKIFYLLCMVLLAGCASVKAAGVNMTGEIASAAPRNDMVTGTPAVDWQGTAQVAQATADEARRVNAAATAQHEAYLAEGLRTTQSANEMELARVWQTATWAPTAVPLTMTAAASNYAVAEMHLQEVKIAATTTSEAPQKLREMKAAEAYNARVEFGLWGAFIMAGLFVITGIPAALWVSRKTPAMTQSQTKNDGIELRQVSIQPSALEMATPVLIKHEEGGVLQASLQIVPCSEEMLTEFAEGILSGEKTTRFEFWEGNGSAWTRKQYSKFRGWLCQKKEFNQFAVFNDKGEVVILDEGLQFLHAWLNTRKLPTHFEFGNVTQEMKGVTENHRLSTAHAEL